MSGGRGWEGQWGIWGYVRSHPQHVVQAHVPVGQRVLEVEVRVVGGRDAGDQLQQPAAESERRRGREHPEGERRCPRAQHKQPVGRRTARSVRLWAPALGRGPPPPPPRRGAPARIAGRRLTRGRGRGPPPSAARGPPRPPLPPRAPVPAAPAPAAGPTPCPCPLGSDGVGGGVGVCGSSHRQHTNTRLHTCTYIHTHTPAHKADNTHRALRAASRPAPPARGPWRRAPRRHARPQGWRPCEQKQQRGQQSRRPRRKD